MYLNVIYVYNDGSNNDFPHGPKSGAFLVVSDAALFLRQLDKQLSQIGTLRMVFYSFTHVV